MPSVRVSRAGPDTPPADRISTAAGAFRARDDVEHPVKPVDEVDVEGAWRSVHRLGSRCPSAGRVAGKIVRAEIGLGFRNRKSDTLAADAAHERPSEQLTRDDIGRPFEKGRPEDGTSPGPDGHSAAGPERFACSQSYRSSMTERVIKLAQERHMTVATVESCTARSLAHFALADGKCDGRAAWRIHRIHQGEQDRGGRGAEGAAGQGYHHGRVAAGPKRRMDIKTTRGAD